MLIIKATKDTLKDMNVKPAMLEATDPFYSWHVNFFTLYGKKHYVFMNDLSRLSLTVRGIRSNQSNIDSRSVLSTLSEIMLVMKSLERDKEGFENQEKRHKWNNRFIFKPIDYNQPIDVFMNELKNRYIHQ